MMRETITDDTDITMTCVSCNEQELIPVSLYENDAALVGWYLKTEDPETWECGQCVGKPTTNNRAEGEQEHSPLPWRWIDRSEHGNIASRDSQIPFAIERVSTTHYAVEPIADICNFPPATPAQTARQRANATFIVRACNEHYERGERIAHLESQLNADSDYEALQRDEIEARKQQIEQLEQVIRDQMSALSDWRGADNVPQQVRDAMAIRLTELRRVVEAQR